MANSFDSHDPNGDPDIEKQAKNDFGKLKRDLLRVHPDHHPQKKYGDEIYNESERLMRDISGLIAGIEMENISWVSRLARLNYMKTQKQADIDSFFEKVKAKDEEIDNNSGPSKGATFTEKEWEDRLKEKQEASQATREKTATDKDKRMEKLEEELAAARKDYLEMDYKKKTMFKRVRNYFGGNIDMANDQDIEYMRAHYENKLIDWKNAKLDAAKGKGISNEELGKIVLEISKESTVNLAQAHDEVKFDHVKESWDKGKVGNQFIKFSEWYKKQPLKYKIGVGAALGIGGFAAGALGATSVAAVFSTAMLGRRLLVGAVTGTGAKMWMEGKTAARREAKTEDESQKFVKKIESFDEDKKLEEVELLLKEKIFSVDKSLSSIEYKKIRNLVTAGALGTFVGSGAMSLVLEKFGITGQGGKAGEWMGKMKEYFGKQDLAPMGGSTGFSASGLSETGVSTPEVSKPEATIAEGAKISKEEIGSPRATKGKEYFEKLKEFQEEKPKVNLSKEAVVSDLHNVKELPKTSVEKNVAGGVNRVEDMQAKTAPESVKAPEEIKTGKKIPSPREKIIGAKPEIAEAPTAKTPEIAEVPGGKKLTVGQWEKGKMGGSFEGELKRYLVEEKKMNKTEAGKLAHRMRMDFQKEHPAPKGFSYHKIMPGAQIEIGSDGKVANFHDGAGSKWPEHGVKTEPKLAAVPKAEEIRPVPAPEEPKLSTPKAEPASSAGEELKPATTTENIEKGKIEKELPPTKVHVSKIIEKDLIGRGMDEINAKSQADALASGYQESDDAFKMASTPENVEIRYEYGSDGKIVRVDGLYEKLNLLPGEDFRERTEKVLKNISLGSTEIWGKMKNLNAFTIKESGEINVDVKKNIMALKDLFKNSEALGKLGENAEPKENETMLGWLSRIIKLSMTKRNPYEGSI